MMNSSIIRPLFFILVLSSTGCELRSQAVQAETTEAEQITKSEDDHYNIPVLAGQNSIEDISVKKQEPLSSEARADSVPLSAEKSVLVLENRRAAVTSDNVLVSACSGLFIPVSRYAERYSTALCFSADTALPVYAQYGFYPAAAISYSRLKSKSDPALVRAVIDLITADAGIRQVFSSQLPSGKIFSNECRLSYGIDAGITRVAFTSENQRTPVVEFVPAIGACAGFSYDIYQAFSLGIKFAAQRIFTAGVPLDSLGVSLTAGARW